MKLNSQAREVFDQWIQQNRLTPSLKTHKQVKQEQKYNRQKQAQRRKQRAFRQAEYIAPLKHV